MCGAAQACFKPGAFYRGIIIPLCQSVRCQPDPPVLFCCRRHAAEAPHSDLAHPQAAPSRPTAFTNGTTLCAAPPRSQWYAACSHAQGTCTLQKAVIIASVLAKTSIPVLHSAVALTKLAQLEFYSPVNR